MLKNTLIIALIVVIIYLYYQNKKLNQLPPERIFIGTDLPQEIEEVKKVNQIMAEFCKNEIGGKDINEIRTKLNGRKLTEILAENEDYETTTDELIRKKGELEAEVTNLTTTWKNRVGEKERIISRITQEKKDLETKYKKKAKLLDEEQCENNKLTEKLTNLEQQIKNEKASPLPQSWETDRITQLETTLRQKESKLQELEKVIRNKKK